MNSSARSTLILRSLMVASCGTAATWNAQAHADIITVGSDVTCARPTIQSAIDRAKALGGQHRIQVSGNGDANLVRRENLIMTDMSVEIVGGYATCSSNTPSGRTTVSGSLSPLPTMRIFGGGAITLRNLNIRDGTRDPLTITSAGIVYAGQGTLALANTTVAHNHGSGIDINGAGGVALLDLLGGVAVSDNEALGIMAQGQVRVRAHSANNEISGNNGNGIVLSGASVIDFRSSGTVIQGNHGFGIHIQGSGFDPGRVSYIDSVDPANPVVLADNRYGAIYFVSDDTPTWMCTRNLRIDGNGAVGREAATVTVRGNARLEMNVPCGWATPMPVCAAGPERCNSVTGNFAGTGYSLFSALEGGAIVADRLWIEANAVESIFATNAGSDESNASIVVTNVAAVNNPLRGVVAESRAGAHLQIRASTFVGESGGTSFRGAVPGALIVRDTIVARSAPLLQTDTPSRTVLTNVLSPHRQGARPNDHIIVGNVRFRPGSICLQSNALGIDHAGIEIATLDIFGSPREIDNPSMPNIGGARDIGACEDDPIGIDQIFSSGFD